MRSAYEKQRRLAALASQQEAAVAQTLVDDGRRELDAKRSMVRHVSHEIRYGGCYAFSCDTTCCGSLDPTKQSCPSSFLLFFFSSFLLFFLVDLLLVTCNRTPLNITAVGMDIVATELKKLGDVVPSFLLETVESCQEACASSLEVRVPCVCDISFRAFLTTQFFP